MQRLILTGPSICGITITSSVLTTHADICVTNELRTYMHAPNNDHAISIYNNIKIRILIFSIYRRILILNL